MLNSGHAARVEPDVAILPESPFLSANNQAFFNVVDSSLSVATDVANLFARFGAGDGAVRYREIQSDADAAAAAARWPLLAEWLSGQPPTEPRR